MPLGLDQRVGALVWSPLGWGRLTGRIRRGQPLPGGQPAARNEVTRCGPQVPDEHLYKVVDALDEIAKETGKTIPQIALIGCCIGRLCPPSSSALATEEQLRAESRRGRLEPES